MRTDTAIPESPLFFIVFIALSVIAGNWVSMFGLDVPIGDDLYGLVYALDNTVPWHFASRNPTGPIVIYSLMELTAVSIYLARALIVVLCVVPVSLAFFHLYRNILGIDAPAAAAAAVIPSILPGQNIIFHCLIQSYMAVYLLPILASLFLGVMALRRESFYLPLIASIALYFISCISVEQAVFLLVPFSLIFLITAPLGRKHIYLIASFFIIACHKAALTLLRPWPATTPTDHSLHEIARRCVLFFQYALPVPVDLTSAWDAGSHQMYLVIGIAAVLIVSGFLVGYLTPRGSGVLTENGLPSFPARKRWVLLYLFGILWTLSTFLPFLISYAYNSRHVYVASIGFNLILVLSVVSIVRAVFRRRQAAVVIVCLLMIGTAVIGRSIALSHFFQQPNRYYSLVSRELNYDFPEDSQVVLFGPWYFENGHWNVMADGYIKFVTKRPDIDGTVPFENSFCDPFSGKGGYGYKNVLDVDRPLFIYRIDPADERLIPVEYALQWIEPADDSPWVVYRLDLNTGENILYAEGVGYERYMDFLNEAEREGIHYSDIAWGDIRDAAERFPDGSSSRDRSHGAMTEDTQQNP